MELDEERRARNSCWYSNDFKHLRDEINRPSVAEAVFHGDNGASRKKERGKRKKKKTQQKEKMNQITVCWMKYCTSCARYAASGR
jgi:hypothetical protein